MSAQPAGTSLSQLQHLVPASGDGMRCQSRCPPPRGVSLPGGTAGTPVDRCHCNSQLSLRERSLRAGPAEPPRELGTVLRAWLVLSRIAGPPLTQTLKPPSASPEMAASFCGKITAKGNTAKKEKRKGREGFVSQARTLASCQGQSFQESHRSQSELDERS